MQQYTDTSSAGSFLRFALLYAEPVVAYFSAYSRKQSGGGMPLWQPRKGLLPLLPHKPHFPRHKGNDNTPPLFLYDEKITYII